jgi:serine/threonine-protein kinase
MLNFDFAYSLIAQKNFGEAIRYFLRCTSIRPDVAGVWQALGNAYRENGEAIRSREALQRSVELSPDHGPTRIDLSWTLLELGEFEQAGSEIEAAIQSGMASAEAFLQLGRANMELGNFAEALVALESAAEHSAPDSANQKQISELILQCRKKLAE